MNSHAVIFRYHTPRWAVLMLNSLALLFGLGLFAVLLVWGMWYGPDSWAAKLLLLAMACVFTFIGLGPVISRSAIRTRFRNPSVA